MDSSGAGNASDTLSRNTVRDFARGIRLDAASGNAIADNTSPQYRIASVLSRILARDRLGRASSMS
jgi:parallel beta-helix repeat protein